MPTQSENRVKLLTQAIDERKRLIERASDVEQLLNSRLYKRVIERGYLQDTALALVADRANHSTRSDPVREASNTRKLDAISEFKAYIEGALALGSQAELQVSEMESEADHLREFGDAALVDYDQGLEG